MIDPQSQSHQYSLTLICVKMTVKFPCKMKLDHNGSGLTSEISSNQTNKFIFNQDVTLKSDQKQFIQISINLITQKGGKYIAGVLKLFNNDISHAQGQKLTIPLTKCLDSQAFCQLRVNQVLATKQPKKPYPQVKSKVTFESPKDNQFNSMNKLKAPNYNIAQTKSQFQFPVNSRRPKQQWEQLKSKHNIAQSYYNRNMNRSPNKSPTKVNPYQIKIENIGRRSQIGIREPIEIDRDKFIEAEVYKEGYNKLKQKYKKQAENAKNELNKRITLESTQNNLKLEIMRLKLRSQEQQKTINEKNMKIKEMQNIISNYQKKQLDLGYLREEINNKDHSIRILEENIKTITRDNEELKTLNYQRTMSQQEKTKQLKKQIELQRQKAQAKQAQLERELRAKTQALYIRQSELQSKNQILNREKKLVQELQRQNQNKSIQLERSLQIQKSNSRSKIDELKLKIDKNQKNIINIQNQKNQLQSQLEKVKSIQVKLQYENRVLMQQIDSLKTQLAGMKAYKDKYAQLFRDHKLLIDDKNHIQKQLEKALQSKQMSTSQLNKQHIQQVQYFRKANKQLDQKQRNLSNRVVELEGLLDSSRISQQKLKKSIQSITNQLNQLKQKQKSLKKSLKAKEQQAITLDNDLTTTKQKLKSVQHFYKHQLDKYKQQLEKVKNDYENSYQRNIQLNQQNAVLSVELGKLKVKLQFTQEKVQKDVLDMKQKKQQIQNIVKEYQNQIASLNETIQNLRSNEKDLISKMQKQQIESVRSQQKIQRLVKQLKVVQQKHQFAENMLKNRQSESTVIQSGKKQLQIKFYKLEEEISSLKADQSHLLADKNKNQKVIELLQEENTKLRKQNQKLKEIIEQKQKNIQELISEVKRLKEDINKLQMKFNNITKEFQRFKESTMEGINNSFSQVLPQKKQINNTVSNISRKSFNELAVSTGMQNINQSEINNLIINYSKQTKITISKLTQQNRHLVRQNQKLQEQLAGNINRGQTSQYQYSKQIEDLQAQLAQSYAIRDQEGIKYDHIIKQLNAKVRQKDRQINDLHSQCDELNFFLNTTKVEHDNQMNQHSKKSAILKSKISQLQERIQFMNMNITNMEQKIHDQEMECQGIRGALRVEKQNGVRKERIISQLQQRRDLLEEQIQEGKKYRKDLLQKNSTLQLLLNSQRQQNQKIKQLLQQEEQKSMQLKTFIGSLMKQKQVVIKNQLQKSQQIIILQSSILQLTRDKDILAEDNIQLSKQLDEAKQSIKKIALQVKDSEVKINEQKAKNQKLSQKLKEKQKQVILNQQSIQKLQSKNLRQTQRGQKSESQLKIELQAKTQQLLKVSKEYNDKCFNYQKQKHNAQSIINQLKLECSNMQQQIFNVKHSLQTRTDQINSLNGQIAELKIKIDSLQLENHQLGDQIRERQQTAFQLSAKLYNLQAKLQSKQIQKNQKIVCLDNDWIGKYQIMCQEYQQRLALIQKERQYYKERMHDQEQQLKKIVNEKNIIQIEDSKMRGILQQKIKQLEEQRLSIISQKNSQIQKINEENKIQFETLKLKQSQSRKTLHEIEVLKGQINKFQLKNKEMEDKIKNINRIYQAQIDQLKKKDSLYKNFKQSVSNKIWNSERQVRRLIQSFIKKGMEACDDSRTSHRFIEAMKGFQQTVADAMKINLEQAN